jgi:Helitron helicase-like domain at N-terminus
MELRPRRNNPRYAIQVSEDSSGDSNNDVEFLDRRADVRNRVRRHRERTRAMPNNNVEDSSMDSGESNNDVEFLDRRADVRNRVRRHRERTRAMPNNNVEDIDNSDNSDEIDSDRSSDNSEHNHINQRRIRRNNRQNEQNSRRREHRALNYVNLYLQRQIEKEEYVRNATRNQISYYEASFEFRQLQIQQAEREITVHSLGLMDKRCRYCGAHGFQFEMKNNTSQQCCLSGKLRLPEPRQYPEFLHDMLINTANPHHANFVKNLRQFNSGLSMTSLATKTVNAGGRGPLIIKMHGMVYHLTNSVMEAEVGSRSYNQLYFIDTEDAHAHRMNHPANEDCDPEIFRMLDQFLRANNLNAQSYMMMHEVENEQNRLASERNEPLPTVSLVFRKNIRSDQRRFNLPNSNAIAAVFVDENGEPPFDRDFQTYVRPNIQNPSRLINLGLWSPHLEGMTYPVLNPYGELGWEINWESQPYPGVSRNPIRTRVTMLQYICAKFSIRDNFEPRLHSGKLTQQWITDMYTQTVASNLEYIRRNQTNLRATSYRGLQDYIAQDDSHDPGVRVILPSTFEGSPRNMREQCADAMSLFASVGAPDLFITVTANSKWFEITSNMMEHEIVENRPDVVCRVCNGKFKEIVDLICKKNYFGVVLGYVYTIEFQKRGLPHMHLLVTLHPDYKFTTPERVDEVVSCEIPDKNLYPELFKVVTTRMIHGPCGRDNPESPCMVDGECSKNFPKQFQEETSMNVYGYPLYRRRSDRPPVRIRTNVIDTRYVVPYNAELLLKFQCHINVEVCTSLKAVKYIHKYIWKGGDAVDISVRERSGVSNNNPLDEITSYASARYVSPQEACWHIRQNKSHDRSHAIVRLPVHLQDFQRVCKCIY